MLEPAAVAEDAAEAMRADAAAQVALELPLDVPRQGGAVRARGPELGAQGLEVAGHEAVEQRALRRARPVRRARAAGRIGYMCAIEPGRRLVLHCEVHARLQRACQIADLANSATWRSRVLGMDGIPSAGDRRDRNTGRPAGARERGAARPPDIFVYADLMSRTAWSRSFRPPRTGILIGP